MNHKIDGDTLLLIDGSSYIYRAYYAIRQSLTTHKGFPTKAIYGVTNMLISVLKKRDPQYVAVAWDAKGPTFRHDLYDEYKANRPPMPDDLAVQISYIRDVTGALGFPQLEVRGYEADDIIATLVHRMPDRDIIIVTGDKDLLQLVSERVSIWDPMKDEFIDLNTVRERFGLEPDRLTEVMALSGDTADNIPGIPGVGPKTAQKLIRTYGSIEGLLNSVDSLKGKLRERIEQNGDRLPLWKKLVSLSTDVPVPVDIQFFVRRPPDQNRLRELFKELEFTSFLREIAPEKIISFDRYKAVTTEDQLKAWAEKARKAGSLVIDTETTSEFPMKARLVGISMCVEPPEAAYIPVGHVTDEPQMPLDAVRRILSPVLEDPDIEKVGQNIKYDLLVLQNHGINLSGISGDTMIASYLLNPSKHQHNLEEIARETLGYKMISFKDITSSQKGKRNFARVPVSLARDYSCEDVHVTALVRDILWERLKDASLWDLFIRVEVPLVMVLARMERAGILVDRQGLDELASEFTERMKAVEKEIYDLAGCRFNINSPKQLQDVLFSRLKLPQKKKTRKKTGYSTDVEVLTELARHHPLPGKILEYRNLAKLKSTYVDGLRRMLDPETGRIHTSFNQTVTATGRLSSSDPNLQNIPVRTEEGRRIRGVFIAPDGYVLLSADYSQIDLRVLAHYSRDPALVDAFRKGEDVHTRTASEIFGVVPELVTADMRRAAKTVNFGIIYGMSAYGLAKELDISRKTAGEFIEKYFARYTGVKTYTEDIVRQARRNGYVTTLLGRRRYIPDLNSRVRAVREFSERTAVNTPIQGSAADIIKLAMLKVDEKLKTMGDKARILLQVHDELVIEVPESSLTEISGMVKSLMESVVELCVPLTVNVSWGRNWAELKD